MGITEEITPKIEDLQWRCLDCNLTAPPTNYDYMSLLKHAKGHRVRLVNIKTGVEVATSPKMARAKGIDIQGGKMVKAPGGAGSSIDLSEDGLTFPVTLPPLVFTLFDMGKAGGFIPEDTDMDSWLFECVMKRFELDYKLTLALTEVSAEGGDESKSRN